MGLLRYLRARMMIIIVQARFSWVDDSPAALGRDLDDWYQRLHAVARYHGWRYLHRQWYDAFDGEDANFTALPPWIGDPLEIWANAIQGARTSRELAHPLHPGIIPTLRPEVRNKLFRKAYQLIYGVSLMREQAALIRENRIRLAQGRLPHGRPSAVCPQAHWNMTYLVADHTVTLELVGAPDGVREELPQLALRLTWKYLRPGEVPVFRPPVKKEPIRRDSPPTLPRHLRPSFTDWDAIRGRSPSPDAPR